MKNICFADLNQRITLQSIRLQKEELGETANSWEYNSMAWAKITLVKINSSQQKHLASSNAYYNIIIRYREDISEEMRVKFKQQTFKIIKIINKEPNYQILYCKE